MLCDWRSRYYHCDSIVTCVSSKHVSTRTALYRQHRPQGFQLFSTKMYGAQAYVPRYGLADDADDYDDTQEELTKDSPWPPRNAPAFDLVNSFMERSDHKRTFDIILLQYPQASIFNNCLYVCR